MPFYVGQKVVCVDDTGIINGRYVEFRGVRHLETNSQIYCGEVYTVAWLGLCPKLNRNIFHLFERERPCGLGYCTSRFRPVVERKTDISALKALLNTVPDEVPA